MNDAKWQTSERCQQSRKRTHPVGHLDGIEIFERRLGARREGQSTDDGTKPNGTVRPRLMVPSTSISRRDSGRGDMPSGCLTVDRPAQPRAIQAGSRLRIRNARSVCETKPILRMKRLLRIEFTAITHLGHQAYITVAPDRYAGQYAGGQDNLVVRVAKRQEACRRPRLSHGLSVCRGSGRSAGVPSAGPRTHLAATPPGQATCPGHPLPRPLSVLGSFPKRTCSVENRE
jgi:hypothetical protein